MPLVTDRDVLPGLEQEVAAAEADHDRATDARGPDDRALEDLPQMLEQRVAAVLGGLDDSLVLVSAEREPVGAADPVVQQPLDRGRHGSRIEVGLRAERQRLVGRRLGDPAHRLLPPVEHGLVLGDGHLVGGLVQRFEVGVLRTAVEVAELGQRELEGRPELDERKHLSPGAGHPIAGSRIERFDAPEVRGRVLPAVRTREVDELAGGERRREPLSRLVVELLPARIADRRE